jgi:hypothetical protein
MFLRVAPAWPWVIDTIELVECAPRLVVPELCVCVVKKAVS